MKDFRMARDIRMCSVNPELIEAVGHLVGTQSEIMTRAGISWNSWIKIVSGLPVRLSVGERLRARVLREAETIPDLRKMFPPSKFGEIVDHRAIERVVLTPVIRRSGGADNVQKPLSVREANSLRACIKPKHSSRQGTGDA